VSGEKEGNFPKQSIQGGSIMLMTFFFVGCALAVPELILVFNCAPLRRFIERNPIIEMVFSLALSALLAWAMGLGVGVTLAIGNIFSTAITLAFYHFDIMGKYERTCAAFSAAKTSVLNVYQELSTIVHVFYSIITSPFTGLMKGVRAVNRRLEK
jgi:hypothetical protein